MDKGDRKLVGWWALLVVLTLFSFESGVQWLEMSGITAALVIAIALIKMRVVIQQFMEVRHAPWSLRAPMELWSIALGLALLVMWYGHAG